MMRNPLCALPLLLLGLGVTSSAGAQEEPSSDDDARAQDGVSAMYGGVTVAGQADDRPKKDAKFGLGRLYGGVTGRVGLSGVSRPGGPKKGVPTFHVVKKGDTLWDMSNTYYGNPWAWPQVWSLNPQVENPHWIYPGDQIRTTQASKKGNASGAGSTGGGGMLGRVVPPGTVFVRDQGYLGDPDRDVWGEVSGAHKDLILLTDGDTIYLQMKEGVDLRLGQRLTVFNDIVDPPEVAEGRTPPGRIVKVYGTVRVDGWDRDTRVAKTSLIESMDPIERGFRVGPVGRRFDVVPPKAAEVDLEARLLSGLYPHIYFGQNQLVFIDKGSDDGLVVGNRLRVLRRGDTWRRKLNKGSKHQRLRIELGAPEVAEVEVTPLRGDDEKYPDEVVGEVIVLRTEEFSAICLVSSATRGLQPGDRLAAVKGY